MTGTPYLPGSGVASAPGLPVCRHRSCTGLAGAIVLTSLVAVGSWTRDGAAPPDVAGPVPALTALLVRDRDTTHDVRAQQAPGRTPGATKKIAESRSPRTGLSNPAPVLSATETALPANETARPATQTARSPTDPAHPETVVESLAFVPGRRALETLRQAFDNPDPAVRDAAAWALGQRGGDDALAVLVSMLPGANSRESLAIVDALHEIGTPAAIGRLGQIQSDIDPRIREAAAEALDDLRGRHNGY